MEPRGILDGQFSTEKISCLCRESDYNSPVFHSIFWKKHWLNIPGCHSNMEYIWVLRNRKQKKEDSHFFLGDYQSMLKFP